MSIHQLSIFLENRAGQLAEITELLSSHGIDLRAIHIAETADYGLLRIIVSDARAAADILSRNDYVLNVTPVVAVAVPDRPGGLSELLKTLSEAQIDISYMYSVFGQHNGMAYMIFRVDDPERLQAVLEAQGSPAAAAEDLGLR